MPLDLRSSTITQQTGQDTSTETDYIHSTSQNIIQDKEQVKRRGPKSKTRAKNSLTKTLQMEETKSKRETRLIETYSVTKKEDTLTQAIRNLVQPVKATKKPKGTLTQAKRNPVQPVKETKGTETHTLKQRKLLATKGDQENRDTFTLATKKEGTPVQQAKVTKRTADYKRRRGSPPSSEPTTPLAPQCR